MLVDVGPRLAVQQPAPLQNVLLLMVLAVRPR